MAKFISCPVVQAQHYFPCDHIRTPTAILVSYIPTLPFLLGERWQQQIMEQFFCSPLPGVTKQLLDSAVPVTLHGWHHGMADSHPQEIPCGVHPLSGLKQVLQNTQEWFQIQIQILITPPRFQKHSLYWPFGKYLTLFTCMALFADLAPWTTRTDQEQQWAFCL